MTVYFYILFQANRLYIQCFFKFHNVIFRGIFGAIFPCFSYLSFLPCHFCPLFFPVTLARFFILSLLPSVAMARVSCNKHRCKNDGDSPLRYTQGRMTVKNNLSLLPSVAMARVSCNKHRCKNDGDSPLVTLGEE